MNYLTLINHFWNKDLEYSFTPLEVAVYFRLLDRSNALNWKNPFNFSVEDMLVRLRLRTKDPFDTARQRLREAGLILYQNGQGRGCTTTYFLNAPEEKAGSKSQQKGGNASPFSPPVSPSLSPDFPPQKSPYYNKPSLSKNEKEAHASGVRAENFELKEKADSTPGLGSSWAPPPDPSPVAAPPFPISATESDDYSACIPATLKLPYDTPAFRAAWTSWRDWLREANKPYRGGISEQKGLDKLAHLAAHSEQRAIHIIDYSISGRWLNLCQPSTSNHVQTNTSRSASRPDASRRTQFPARLSYANDRA